MTDLAFSDVVDGILSGNFDSKLDDLSNVITDRRKTKSRAKFFELSPGNKCTLKNLKPKYLVGAPCTVVGRKQTRIAVVIDPEWLENHPQASRWVGEITATPNMLDKVDDNG